MKLRIRNREARRLWLHAQGLAEAPTGCLDTLAIIERLGFVQLDTIRVVARAHDHILWSRHQTYREPKLNKLLAKDRAVFEHFTHDASVLPMTFYPLWQRQFKRQATRVAAWYKSMPDAKGRAAIKERIALEGPLSARDFESDRPSNAPMWTRSPHKLALDYMWYAGELSTSHRDGFAKFYDLSERVIPEDVRLNLPSDAEQIDRLCAGALDRLGFGNAGEIQRFWDAVSSAEVKSWVEAKSNALIEVEVETADGSLAPALALPDIEARLAVLPAATSRLRILNPFDPAVRDRTRLERLFGFDYRIEIFVPASKRKWGYYVFPLLEGDRFVGRIEARADRKAGLLTVLNFWTEPGVRWGKKRYQKLEAELERFGRFVGITSVIWQKTPEAIPG